MLDEVLKLASMHPGVNQFVVKKATVEETKEEDMVADVQITIGSQIVRAITYKDCIVIWAWGDLCGRHKSCTRLLSIIDQIATEEFTQQLLKA
jgi:hypothetical protein